VLSVIVFYFNTIAIFVILPSMHYIYSCIRQWRTYLQKRSNNGMFTVIVCPSADEISFKPEILNFITKAISFDSMLC